MYDYEGFDDMAKRDKDMTLYSQSNVIASYISMIKFAIEQIELQVDEIGDEVYFDGDTSPFPPDQPWDKECQCDDCRCGTENKINASRMSVGNIMDMLSKTRKTNAPSH